MIESPLVPIALTGGIDKRQVAWMPRGRTVRVPRTDETLLDRDRNLLSEADADEAASR
jgi:hypothetical protein